MNNQRWLKQCRSRYLRLQRLHKGFVHWLAENCGPASPSEWDKGIYRLAAEEAHNLNEFYMPAVLQSTLAS